MMCSRSSRGGASVGKALVDANIEKIFFIGSTGVGRKIMIQAAPDLKKSVLELNTRPFASILERYKGL